MKRDADETKILAAKLLAQLLAGENPQTEKTDLSEVLSRLDQMNARLVNIENRFADSAVNDSPPIKNSFKSNFPAFLHSSQDRFAIEEAADFETNEKACRFEPGGKPCDHCAMCSSRGF